MTGLEKAARALYESWANVPACSDSKPWEERAAKMPASAEMFRKHARAVISSIEVDDAMVEVAAAAHWRGWVEWDAERRKRIKPLMISTLKAALRSILDEGEGR
jgi:hypothetical protein